MDVVTDSGYDHGISIYSKQIYYHHQEEVDYFTFRFVILASCVFPAVFFSFREKHLLIPASLSGFFILLAHDPLHTLFGVPYQRDVLKESSYAFTNVVIFITYVLMMSAVFFLKWISENSEERANKLIQELNQTNGELTEKNNEIEAQNTEISAQTESLNLSQQKLQQAYEVIEEQKELLSSELTEINEDLTATNSELIKHNNELRQFSFTVSHNLRGPVASLMGLINLMDQEENHGAQGEFYNHIKTSVNRLDNIISDLSKIIDIRHDIFHIRQKINLDAEVKEILNGLKKDIDDHAVIVKTDFTRCPEIYSVRPMVHSILYNLISNAIKYRSPSRTPEISISSNINKKYTLQVSDNGLGIDLKNNQSNLFKLYKRFHFHTEGKGLGLYLVKLQAEALGGRVDVSSELNRSTSFTVLLGQPNNVQQQILYQKPYAKIYFDATINATGIEWHAPISSEQYRDVFQKCLEFVKVYGTPNYISDLSDQGHVSRDDQQWMFREILPETFLYGLRNIAAILPAKNTPTFQEYLNGIVAIVSRLGIKQEHFLQVEDAIEWIKSENRKNTVQKP